MGEVRRPERVERIVLNGKLKGEPMKLLLSAIIVVMATAGWGYDFPNAGPVEFVNSIRVIEGFPSDMIRGKEDTAPDTFELYLKGKKMMLCVDGQEIDLADLLERCKEYVGDATYDDLSSLSAVAYWPDPRTEIEKAQDDIDRAKERLRIAQGREKYYKSKSKLILDIDAALKALRARP